jgi:hypothetical protein
MTADLALAAFVLATGLVCVTGLVGFLALTSAWYLTHRAQPMPLTRKQGLLEQMVPPPVMPEPKEIVLHPEIEDYIKQESESFYREILRERAKKLYSEHPDWPWVLAQIRKDEEANALPEL